MWFEVERTTKEDGDVGGDDDQREGKIKGDGKDESVERIRLTELQSADGILNNSTNSKLIRLTHPKFLSCGDQGIQRRSHPMHTCCL